MYSAPTTHKDIILLLPHHLWSFSRAQEGNGCCNVRVQHHQDLLELEQGAMCVSLVNPPSCADITVICITEIMEMR
jgi:hypothetical protein